MATKYRVIKLFHESETSPIVLTELIVTDQNQVPGNATPYDDLVPINLTNQMEACRATISYTQRCMQDHILTEYHNISRGMGILKLKMEKMNKDYEELETI